MNELSFIIRCRSLGKLEIGGFAGVMRCKASGAMLYPPAFQEGRSGRFSRKPGANRLKTDACMTVLILSSYRESDSGYKEGER